MANCRKAFALVVLVTIFVASPFLPVPQASAVFRQRILNLTGPNAVDAGASFTVSIGVRYDFTGEGDVRVWARVRDPSTGGDVAHAAESARTVRDTGDLTWSFRMTAHASLGDWSLEAYAFHWEGTLEVVDDTRAFTVTIRAPAVSFDFSLATSPDTVSLVPGGTSSATVRVELVSGAPQEVSLMYTIPQVTGIGASLSQMKGTPPFTSTLRITTTRQTPLGRYTLNIAGVGDGIQKRVSVILTVAEQPPPPARFNFSLTVTPSILSIERGKAASTSVNVGLVTGPAEEVMLMYTIPAQIAGVSASLSRTTGDPPFTSELSILTSDESPLGRYEITVGGVSGTLQKTAVLVLTVTEAPQPPAGFDFSITVRPESQSLTPEGSVVYDVYVDLQAGTSDTVSLTVSGLPEDATFAFDPPTESPYFQSRLTIYVPEFTAAGAPMPAGTYTLEVAGEGGGLVRTVATTLIIEAAGVVTTQLPQTTTQATVTSEPTSAATTQTARGLGGGAIFLLLVTVVVVAGAAYYVRRRRKTKSEPEPVP
jgi:hypothetical protein